MSTVPAVRWTLAQAANVSALTLTQQLCAQYGGFVRGVELFDAVAFGISPAEVASMDPQQRLLLDHSYTALHKTAHRRATLMGGNTGVFLGIAAHDFWLSRILSFWLTAFMYFVTF